ncbi:HWE histidine kinase domain-containing protein [Sphingomonas sp. RB3P16]|uniref:HWE histidine kinase domain-containing protein n=1 Tax=Parasphingomonas frigoris TaxID=3096163 RepID=UPI002FC7262F
MPHPQASLANRQRAAYQRSTTDGKGLTIIPELGASTARQRTFDRLIAAAVLRPSPAIVAYPGAIALILTVSAFRAVIATDQLPFLLFIPALIFIALILGRGPSYVAIALSALLADYFFLQPELGFALRTPQLIALAIYVAVDVAIVELCSEVRISYAKRERELTELRRVRDTLADKEAFLTGVLESSNDCIKVLDLDARLTFMSKGGKRVMEVDDFGAIHGCPWPDFWIGQGNVAAHDAIAKARGGGIGQFQGLADTVAGTPKWWDVVVTPIKGSDGTPERLLAISRDITESKTAEQQLALSQERLELALGANGMIGIWDWDLASDLVYSDPNFARLHAITPERAAHGAPLGAYTASFHPEDLPRFEAALVRLFEGAPEFECEYRVLQDDGAVKWVLARGKLVRDADGTPRRLPAASVDLTDLKRAEEQQQLLNHELAHRLKNMLAIVQAIVGQTLRQAETVEDAREALTARLAALATAHEVLVQSNWEDADVGSVVTSALAPHSPGASRLAIRGPAVPVSARCALGLGLAMHELATNAVKYGALSVAAGRIDVSWVVRDDGATPRFRLEWRETGGPVVVVPARRGFGSAMIERSLRGYFRGEAVIDFAPGGVVFTLDAPLAGLVAAPIV